MISMAFTGGQELQRAIAGLPSAVGRRVVLDALTDAAEPMVAVARRTVRRHPPAPDIADNIEVMPLPAGSDEFGFPNDTAVAWGPLRGFFYGYYLEFGTVHMGAFPFMRPAFDGQVERSIGIFGERVWVELQSYALSQDHR